MKFLEVQRGNVLIEFVGVVVALLLPVTFIATSCVGVARTYLAQDVAASNATRSFVISQTQSLAFARARAVVATSLRDYNISSSSASVGITCSANPCLQQKAVVTITVRRPYVVSVLGPWLSRTVIVSATHSAMVDSGRL